MTKPGVTVDELARLVEFKSPFVAEQSSTQGCNDFTANNVQVDMGDGQTCSADVRMSCGQSQPGVCECTATSLASPLVCTDI